MSGETSVTPLSLPELERLLLVPAARPAAERLAVSAASLAGLASRPELLSKLLARFRFTGTHRTLGGPVHGFELKRLLLALTLDYETWHPLVPGLTIDWERDVFEPARRFAELAEAASARVTFFVEVGEYLFLREFDPPVHARMEEQLRQLAQDGHEVELHLHPDWLPELGARRDGERWHWDSRLAHAHDYPGDLGELLARCKRTLEQALSPQSARGVRAFRAGAYRAQPLSRLSAALRQAEIGCDSSVFRGGVSAERGYDYTHAFSAHQPYFCSPDDPQLAARPGEESVVELPIATLEFGRRWSVDGADQGVFGDELLRFLRTRAANGTPGPNPALWRARERLTAALQRLSRGRMRRLPRYPAHEPPTELRHGHDYFVAIGHTKGEHDFERLASQLARINQATRAEWVTLGEMAELAREDLSRTEEWRDARGGSAALTSSTAGATPSPTIEAIANAVERALPWTGSGARVLGDHARELAALLGPRFPWKRFTVSGAPAAGAGAGGECSRFATLILADSAAVAGSTLKKWAGDLGPEGRLVVPVAFDGHRLAYPELPSARGVLLREWRFRLETAGYGLVAVHEIPEGRVAGVVVATPGKPPAPREHFLATMDWLYSVVEPADDPATGIEPRRVLSTKRALCLGYTSALGAILERDGFHVEYATLVAHDHARGRPPHGIDSHEVLQVAEPGREAIVLDPMANVMIPHGLLQVLRDPALALPRSEPDERYRERHYELYATSYLYERAFEACLRPSLDVTSFDSAASWRARLKVLSELGRRTIYRKRRGEWHEVRLALDPQAGVPER